jgi:hypothetical protein
VRDDNVDKAERQKDGEMERWRDGERKEEQKKQREQRDARVQGPK